MVLLGLAVSQLNPLAQQHVTPPAEPLLLANQNHFLSFCSPRAGGDDEPDSPPPPPQSSSNQLGHMVYITVTISFLISLVE